MRRARNSEFRIAEPGVAGMRPVRKRWAKLFDGGSACLNRDFRRSGQGVVAGAQTEAPAISRLQGICHFEGMLFSFSGADLQIM